LCTVHECRIESTKVGLLPNIMLLSYKI